mgnify:CR=1 FL=1
MAKHGKTKSSINLDKSYSTTFEAAILAVLLLIFLFPSFLGVFRMEEFFIMHITTGLGLFFILLIYRHKKINLLNLGIDYILFGLVLLYFISIIWAAFPQSAVE